MTIKELNPAITPEAIVNKPRKLTIIDFDKSDQWEEQIVQEQTNGAKGISASGREVVYRTSKYIRPLSNANGEIFYFKHTIYAKGGRD